MALLVHAQPRASKSAIAGLHGDALKVKIAAPPSEGEANEELRSFFAKLFALPRRDVELLAGETSRHKRVLLRGLSAAAASAVLAPLL